MTTASPLPSTGGAPSLHVISAATSAGAYGAGQEKAPAAFVSHGLMEALTAAGRRVVDRGTVASAVFREDPDHPEAGNVPEVLQVCRAVAGAVGDALGSGGHVLVLGGDCTVELGTVAGALAGSDDVGLVYIDLDTDLNTPLTGDGILDWMGAAHLLDVPGSDERLSGLGPRRPMLAPDRLRFAAADRSTDDEQAVIDRMGLVRHSLAACQDDPAAVVAEIAAWSGGWDRLLVHVDIDVLDFEAFPIAENTRRVPGLSLTRLSDLLDGLCHLPGFAALTLCEVNPANATDETGQFADLIEMLCRALSPLV